MEQLIGQRFTWPGVPRLLPARMGPIGWGDTPATSPDVALPVVPDDQCLEPAEAFDSQLR